MLKLIINNSTSQITGFDRNQYQELKRILSYKVDARQSYFGGFYSRTRYLIDKRGNFPTGLVYLVQKWLNAQLKKINVIDLRMPPKRSKIDFKAVFPYPLYPEQEEAAKFAIEATRGVISAITGSGKSFIIAKIVEQLNVRTLIVVPTLELKRQLRETFQQIFKDFNKLPITIENVDALNVVQMHCYDCVIIDEFHHAAAKTYRKLNEKAWVNIYYRFGLTATAFRNKDNEKLLLESVLSKVIYNIPYLEAVKNNRIVSVEAYYIELPRENNTSNLCTWAQVYDKLVVNNERRNKVIANLLLHLHSNFCSSLCLVKEIKHGTNIQKLINLSFANGENPNTPAIIKNFNESKISCIIGTSGIIGEGVDTKPCEFVIIAGLGKAKSQFMQQIGRGIRVFEGKDSCKVIIFKDSNHKFTLRHFNEQVKILKQEYGIEPIKLDFNI